MIDFPSSPTNGQTFAAGATTYTYSTANTRWQVTTASSSNAFQENPQTVADNYTLPAGQNAVSAGKITIPTGKTVVIPTGGRWTIV